VIPLNKRGAAFMRKAREAAEAEARRAEDEKRAAERKAMEEKAEAARKLREAEDQAAAEKAEAPEEIFPEPEKPKSIKDIGKKPARTESDHQPTDPPPPDEQMGETVDPDELAVLDRIGELSRKLGMSEQQAASEQAAYFKTRGIKDATVSALRAYADSLEGRMERE
jgi:translation initiation factor 4G